jgi:hypothetical protein
LKLQIKSKARGKGFPKWVPPEKRMRRYRKNMKDPRKVPFVKFLIVVPTEDDKKQLLAAFEYFHDNRLIDADFIAVNQLAHCYVTPELEKGHPDMIVVDPDLYSDVNREVCQHLDTWVDQGIRICKVCNKHLEVTSYRD